MTQSSREGGGLPPTARGFLGADGGGKRRAFEKQPHPILTGHWGTFMLHWGEEQTPSWRKAQRGTQGTEI